MDNKLPHLTRREFVASMLATGFALATQPVSASTIHTDTTGLNADTVQIPTADRTIPAYRAMPAKGSGFPVILVVQEIFGVRLGNCLSAKNRLFFWGCRQLPARRRVVRARLRITAPLLPQRSAH